MWSRLNLERMFQKETQMHKEIKILMTMLI